MPVTNRHLGIAWDMLDLANEQQLDEAVDSATEATSLLRALLAVQFATLEELRSSPASLRQSSDSSGIPDEELLKQEVAVVVIPIPSVLDPFMGDPMDDLHDGTF